MSLRDELFMLATAPETKLTKTERSFFNLYVKNFFVADAKNGKYQSKIVDATPDSVVKVLEENGFAAKEGFFSWENPPKGSLAMKFFNVSSHPFSGLDPTERLQYMRIIHKARNLASTGKFSMPIPKGVLPNVYRALDLSPEDEFFCWGPTHPESPADE